MRSRYSGLRMRLSLAWRVAGWPLLGALVLTAFLLGYVGFRSYFQGSTVSKSPTDLAYLSLQLFVLESGSVPETGAPWQLEMARLLAPATAAVALMAALVAVFREEIEELRIRWRRDHVVVCGLGSQGSRLVANLVGEGYRVVAIEKDPSNPAVGQARRRGSMVVIGDARNPANLSRARVARASHVVAVAGADDVNAELALRAGAMVSGRGGPALLCLAHITDPSLCVLLRSAELSAGGRPGYRLDFFNIYERTARVLLHEYPARANEGPPSLIVLGLNALGRSVVVEAARQWRRDGVAAGRPLAVTVVDPDAEHGVRLLCARYPQLAGSTRITPIVSEVNPLDRRLLDGPDDPHLLAVYVCVDDNTAALEAALQARRRLRDGSVPIVVQLTGSVGLAGLLLRSPGTSPRVRAIDPLETSLRSDLILGGTFEVLARAIHEEYADEQRRQGATAESNPSLVPWEELPESLKESNRDQAAHIGVKLATIDCGIAPLADWDADQLTFTEEEVELLAEMEHERWTAQRIRDGWKPGPKDIGGKTTPYLVPWEHLSRDVQEWDRRAVRTIPALLARAGYQVVRGDTPGSRARSATSDGGGATLT